MGYSTDFTGELKFKEEPSVKQLSRLNELFEVEDQFYIDLEITQKYTGIKWNGAEKTREMEFAIAWVLEEMQKEWPEFELTGVMYAQGEEIDDRWKIEIVNGIVKRSDIEITGKRINCPNCNCDFILDKEEGV